MCCRERPPQNGYIYESCREKSVIEEMDVDQLYGELNHPIYIQMLYL